MSTPERRGTPRAESRLAIVLSGDGHDIVARTENISASGAYCILKTFLPAMTKLRIRLELPGLPKPRQIRCEGVVVRVEPPVLTPQCTSYRVAIFFNNLMERERAVIAQYVQQRLHTVVIND